MRVLLHPPAAARDAEKPLRQGRRLQALVPSWQLHHPDRSGRRRARPNRRAAPLAALRLRPRDGSRSPPPPPRPAARAPRDPARHGAAGQGRHHDARADRARTRLERRGSARALGARAVPPPPPGRHHRRGARGTDEAPRETAGTPHAHGRGGTPPGPHRRKLAARISPLTRHALRLGLGRGLPPGGTAAARRRRVRGLPGDRRRNRPGPPLQRRLRACGPPAARARGRASHRHRGDRHDVRPPHAPPPEGVHRRGPSRAAGTGRLGQASSWTTSRPPTSPRHSACPCGRSNPRRARSPPPCSAAERSATP